MVRKFRTVEEVNQAQDVVLESDSERLVERVAALCEFSRLLCQGRFKGVHRFRDIEEANHFRLTWMQERATPARPESRRIQPHGLQWVARRTPFQQPPSIHPLTSPPDSARREDGALPLQVLSA